MQNRFHNSGTKICEQRNRPPHVAQYYSTEVHFAVEFAKNTILWSQNRTWSVIEEAAKVTIHSKIFYWEMMSQGKEHAYPYMPPNPFSHIPVLNILWNVLWKLIFATGSYIQISLLSPTTPLKHLVPVQQTDSLADEREL